MPTNIDLSDIDFSDIEQPAAPKAPTTSLDLSGIDFTDMSDTAAPAETTPAPVAEKPALPPAAKPTEEDSWGTVLTKSLTQMPLRMQKAWEGIKQGISVSAANTAQGVTGMQASDLARAAEQGIESATARMAALGYKPSDVLPAEGDDYKVKREKNERFYGLIEKMKMEKLGQDEGFVAARDEGLRIAGELAASAPKTGDQWSAKNLVSSVLTGAADMSPSILTAVLTKSPALGLTEMTGQAYGTYYQDSVDKGLTPVQANQRASLFAALEPVTEAVPLGLLLRKGANKLTDLGKSAIAEGVQEGATEAIQNGYDIGVLDEKMTIGEFLNNVAFSSVVGTGTGATIHSALHAPGMVKEFREGRAIDSAAKAAEAQSGQAVPEVAPGEYDAVAAELGTVTDALDDLVSQAAPEVTTGNDALDDMAMAAVTPQTTPIADAVAQQVAPEQTVAEVIQQEVAQAAPQLPPSPAATAPQLPPAPQVQPSLPTADVMPTPSMPPVQAAPSLPPVQAAPVTPTPQLPPAAPIDLSTVDLSDLVEPAPVVEVAAPKLPPKRQPRYTAAPAVAEVVEPEAPVIDEATRKAREEAYVAAALAEPEVAGIGGKKVRNPVLVTEDITKAAEERGVAPGAKVNWRGKEYDVDKLHGRAIRLLDENGNGAIADIQEVNAPENQPQATPSEQLNSLSDTVLERARERGWDETDSAQPMSSSEAFFTHATEAELELRHRLVDEAAAEKPTPAQAAENVRNRIAERNAKKPLKQKVAEKKAAQAIDVGSIDFSDLTEPTTITTDAGTLKVSPTEDVPGAFDVETEAGAKGMLTAASLNRMAAESRGEETGGAVTETNKFKAAVEAQQMRMDSVDRNSLSDILGQLDNPKRKISAVKADLAAMRKQGATDPTLFDPVKGGTRAALRKEIQARLDTAEGKAADVTESWIADAERMGYEPLTDSDPLYNKYTRNFSGNPVRIVAANGLQLMDENGNRHIRSTTAKKAFDKPADIVEPTAEPPTERDLAIARRKRDNPLYPENEAKSQARKVESSKKKGGAASIKPDTGAKGLSKEEVAEVAADFLRKFKGAQAVDMTVMQQQEDLGIDIPAGQVLVGFYDMGAISSTLIAENFESREEVEAALRHEIITHYGLRARLSKPDYDAQMDNILAAEGKVPALTKYFKAARDEYGNFYDLSKPDGQRMIAEEVMAAVSEKPSVLEKIPLMQRVVEAIRKLLIKAKLLSPKASMTEVVQLIQANAEFLRAYQVDRNDVRVSLPPMGYEAPRDIAPMMNRKTDIDEANVPDNIKDGMRDTMHRDTRSFTEKLKDMLKANNVVSAIYQGVFDDMHAIARYEKIQNQGELKTGRESAYKQSILTKNANSVVSVALNHGAPVYNNGEISVNKDVKGFTEIFKPVMELEGNMLPVWEYWAGAVRAKRLLAEGREQLYTEKQVDDIIDYVNRDPELRKAFNQAHKDWRALNKSVLDFGEATGIIDPAIRKLFENDDYVPFYRVDEEGAAKGPGGTRGLAGQSSGVRKLKGGAGKVDILENMARNVNHIITSGVKNAAMQRVRDITVMDIAGIQGTAGMVELPPNFKPVGISNDAMRKALEDMGVSTSRMTKAEKDGYTNLFTVAAPAGPNIITVRDKGKPVYYEVTDKQLLQSIAGMGPERLHAILRILAIPKKILTRAVTSTPTFVANNMIRDIAGNFVQMAEATGRNTTPKIIADILTLRPVYKAMQGALRSFRNDPMVTDFQVSGGMTGGYDASRPENVAKHLRNLKKRGLIVDSVVGLKNLYDKVLTASEQATRMAVYQDVLETTGDTTEAAYQSNDVLNFSRRGGHILTTIVTSMIPFLNARVQGLDRLARGGIESPKAFLLKGVIITAATMALMSLNADDEQYWALPEFERDNFWIIPVGGVRFRIPKPFEVGAVFGTIPERITEALLRDEKVFGDRMWFMLTNTFAVDWPQFFKPIQEDLINKNSFTDRPIVPFALQRVAPTEQATSSTPEWIKDFVKTLPDSAPDWMRSPVRLQHMIEGYTGSVGQYVVSVADSAYRAAFKDKVMPAAKPFDYPVVRSFVRDGQSSSKYVDRLYQMSEKVGETYGTLKAYKDQGNMQAYKEFQSEHGSVLSARIKINKAVARMQKLNKQTKGIYGNDGMTPEQKRAELDALTEKKNALSKEISDKYWMLF